MRAQYTSVYRSRKVVQNEWTQIIIFNSNIFDTPIHMDGSVLKLSIQNIDRQIDQIFPKKLNIDLRKL
jgi:hypothetical protein